MKTRHLLIFLLILVAWTYVCQWYHCRYDAPSVQSDTVYVKKIVEVKDTTPDIKNEKVIGQVSIPVHSNSPHIGKNDVKETGKTLHDTADIAKKDENLNMTLDIVQRKYTDDSTYTAYVSGLRYDIYPRLDSVIIRQRTVTEHVRHTVTLRPKSPRWNVGLIGGYGDGFKSKNLEPFIGVGVTISLIGG